MTWPRQMPHAPEAHDLSWHAKANCAGVTAALFFPERYDNAADAKRVCASCVVREQRLEYALDTNQQHGIWGGKSIKERNRLKAARQNRGAA